MLPFAAAGVLPWFERLFLFLQVGDGIHHCKPCYLLRIADFGLRIVRGTAYCLLRKGRSGSDGPQSCGGIDILCREEFDTEMSALAVLTQECFTSIVKHRVLLGDVVSSFLV